MEEYSRAAGTFNINRGQERLRELRSLNKGRAPRKPSVFWETAKTFLLGGNSSLGSRRGRGLHLFENLRGRFAGAFALGIAELVGRYSGSGDSNMYTGSVTANSNGTFTAAIYKNIGGTRTLLGSQTVTTGTGTLTFQIVGSDLRLLFIDANGTVLGLVSVFDTSITTSGAVGIRGSNGVTFDNCFISN